VTTPSRAAANWYPDPLGRGEYRYWDGERWTLWIANGGVSRPDTFELPDGLPEPSLLATPTSPPPSTGTPSASPVPFDYPRYRSVAGLTTALTWLLVASIVSAVVVAALTVNHLSKVEAFYDRPSFTTVNDANDAADAVNAMGVVLELISLAIFVVLVVFLFRASKNTELWNTSTRTWTPGWAIAGWFIPLANFVIPFLVVRDIWRRTPEPAGARGDARPVGNWILLVWWVLFVVGAIGIRLDIGPDTLSEHRTEDWIHLLAAIAVAASAVPLIVIVRTLARRQRDTAFPAAG
jgi:hypothetical protein